MAELTVGDIAPNFSMPSTDRDVFDLYEQLKDGPILLNFYVGDFGINCTNYMMNMIDAKDEFKKLGVRYVGVNPDSLESHKMWKDRMGSPFEYVHDEKQVASKEYGAIVSDAFPLIKGFTSREFYLVGTDRRIRYIWKAETPKMLPGVQETLDGVAKGLAVKF